MNPITMYRLDGKVAIVTGASSGLGEQFARALHAAGASLVLAARRADRLAALADELENAVVIPTDVRKRDDIDRLVRTAIEQLGRIDVLVNNAGISDIARAHEQADGEFDAVVQVNLTAPYQLSKRVATHMIDRGEGAIVNVASMLAMVSAARIPQAGYAASKGAVVSLTRELAVQWARKGIRVNALAPGWFESEMTGAMFEQDKALDWFRQQTPMARPGRVGELDGALLFLASSASSFVTGQTIVVDGGWTAV